MVLDTFNGQDFMQNFRMNKSTFLYICEQLRPELQHSDTMMRTSIAVNKRVAVTLWFLATPSEYRTISHLFGIGRSTVCCIIHETVRAIIKALLKKYISFPTGSQLQNVLQGFEEKCNFPQCAGAIDGSHIPIQAPKLNHTDYYNRKGWYSILIQAVVDSDYLFRDINVGWPGSVHDARVFCNSELYHKVYNGTLLQGHSRSINGVDVPVFLVGDAGYPLLSWLLKPYPFHSTLSAAQKTFNYRLSRARIVSEIAFGRLKARWRRLLKANEMWPENISEVIAACCVLHNICEIHGSDIDEEWLQGITNDEADIEDPPSSVSAVGSTDSMRQALIHYCQNNPVPE